MPWAAIIGAIVTAIVSGLVTMLTKWQQDKLNADNAIALATQAAMQTSTTTAQTVQANMSAAVVPAITDVASAQAAFRTEKIFSKGITRSVAVQKSWRAFPLLALIFVFGCGRPTAGVIAQYPVIPNPPPPAAMFANPEVALSDREKAGLTWSSTLYKRVKIYNSFAEQSNANQGYYSTVPAAKQMFE